MGHILVNTMTPQEYFNEVLCDPGIIVGYQFCMIDDATRKYGWTLDQASSLKTMVENRHKDNGVFPFPKTVRYV